MGAEPLAGRPVKRPWQLWVDTPYSRVLLGPGYNYATEEAAQAALDRLVADGTLRRWSDGTVHTIGLGYCVLVGRRS